MSSRRSRESPSHSRARKPSVASSRGSGTPPAYRPWANWISPPCRSSTPSSPACATPASRHLIVDLAGLDFIDSTGLACILRYDAEARQDGYSIALIPGPPAVQRMFQVTETEARLNFIRA